MRLIAQPINNIITRDCISNNNVNADNLTNTQFVYVCGCAGSGKTTLINEKNNREPDYIELGATTGIAAINCNTKTIHSILKFFNYETLLNAYKDGLLQWNLRKIRERKRVLGIEEVSMLSAKILDLLYDTILEINNDPNPKKLGLHLVGDLCQLPVISRKEDPQDMVFKANCWPIFEQNTIKLTKIWRQTNLEFVEAINLIRSGQGVEGFKKLESCGVEFADKLDSNFDGTTLSSKNEQVNTFNTKRLAELPGEMIRVLPKRRGEILSEWKPEKGLIPVEMRFKKDCLVMILSNDTEEWRYVNGDLGHIVNYDSKNDKFVIKLIRNDEVVYIGRIVRKNLIDKDPEQKHFKNNFTPYPDQITKQWVIGDLNYHPIRVAYASTIHKAQGLTLDKVQVDTMDNFFNMPGMSYVALSRSRTPEGLRIIGRPEEIGRRIRFNEELRRFV